MPWTRCGSPWMWRTSPGSRWRSRCRTRSALIVIADNFLELAEHKVDILFANEAELLSLYQTDNWEQAAERVAGHCEIACLTRGEHGSVVITADERIAVPARLVGGVVDTTGAGDLVCRGVPLRPYARLRTRDVGCVGVSRRGRSDQSHGPSARDEAERAGRRAICLSWPEVWPRGRAGLRAVATTRTPSRREAGPGPATVR